MDNNNTSPLNELQRTVQEDALPGILLANLGTPDAPTKSALKRYLAQFLADPRIVEIPRLIWLFILYGIILNIRPKKSAKLYASIWTDEGSPLLAISRKQAHKVSEILNGRAHVELGMRYGRPAIATALQNLQRRGVKKIIVLPLYPQYAAATVGSSFDAVVKELQSWRWVPELHFLSGYTKNPLFTDALANAITEHKEKHGMPQKWVFSYHGIPKFCLTKGDPYFYYCQETTRLCIEKAGLNPDDCITCFQSRFGRAEWLQPYTDKTLETLPAEGVKHIAILSPAFSADCLETLEELKVENKETFIQAGGETYHYIPALNDRDDHIQALVNIIEQAGI